MSEQQFFARVVLVLIALVLGLLAIECFTGWRRTLLYIASAICVTPAVIALFVTAIIG
jgi:hypothetical protein